MTLTFVRPDKLIKWILLLLLFYAMMAVAVPQLKDLGSLNRSDHANRQHLAEAWSAASVQEAMSKSWCGPVDVYLCPDDKYVYTCNDPSNPGHFLGLVVGATSNVVVTGYTASSGYWNGVTGSCIKVGSGLTH